MSIPFRHAFQMTIVVHLQRPFFSLFPLLPPVAPGGRSVQSITFPVLNISIFFLKFVLSSYVNQCRHMHIYFERSTVRYNFFQIRQGLEIVGIKVACVFNQYFDDNFIFTGTWTKNLKYSRWEGHKSRDITLVCSTLASTDEALKAPYQQSPGCRLDHYI